MQLFSEEFHKGSGKHANSRFLMHWKSFFFLRIKSPSPDGVIREEEETGVYHGPDNVLQIPRGALAHLKLNLGSGCGVAGPGSPLITLASNVPVFTPRRKSCKHERPTEVVRTYSTTSTA